MLVEVPFTDLSQTKKRPGLVLLSHEQDYMVAFLTSRVDQAGPRDVVVRASLANGLSVDSAVLVTKLFTLHRSLIARKLGRLERGDHHAVVSRLVASLQETIP